MDLRQQRNRTPDRAAATRPAAAPSQPVTAAANGRGRGMSRTWKIVLGVVAALVIAGLVAYNVFGIGSPIDKSKYQAVFLTNGQVYFGKLSGWGGGQPELTDVYYFQATGGEAAGDAEQPEGGNSTQTLIKLGEEIHKPSDKLVFNKDSILFVENIEDDGQVVEAIKKNQENN